ncbi:hypothetical protein L6452_33490 [Arctium lappa]|uniref:Uncharacterized protein n=1 Tax=Arctium lappa TaxID=4217 RepID=A0ACB8YEV5_ARCLA|nr:hypothetical protein L6452_33490 [Arctium lappa]
MEFFSRRKNTPVYRIITVWRESSPCNARRPSAICIRNCSGSGTRHNYHMKDETCDFETANIYPSINRDLEKLGFTLNSIKIIG